ncbi:MAG: hypothetical protein U0414_44160 [Polyangiaceae bacterium]
MGSQPVAAHAERTVHPIAWTGGTDHRGTVLSILALTAALLIALRFIDTKSPLAVGALVATWLAAVLTLIVFRRGRSGTLTIGREGLLIERGDGAHFVALSECAGARANVSTTRSRSKFGSSTESHAAVEIELQDGGIIGARRTRPGSRRRSAPPSIEARRPSDTSATRRSIGTVDRSGSGSSSSAGSRRVLASVRATRR